MMGMNINHKHIHAHQHKGQHAQAHKHKKASLLKIHVDWLCSWFSRKWSNDSINDEYG